MLTATIMKVWREGLAYLGDNCADVSNTCMIFEKRLSIQHPPLEKVPCPPKKRIRKRQAGKEVENAQRTDIADHPNTA
jgi:hypothetical protein